MRGASSSDPNHSSRPQAVPECPLNLGGHCATSVSKNTNFLVVGDQDFRKFTDGISSSKMKTAQRLRAAGGDIELIAEDDFRRMLEPATSAV
jgi:hypothetical protein